MGRGWLKTRWRRRLGAENILSSCFPRFSSLKFCAPSDLALVRCVVLLYQVYPFTFHIDRRKVGQVFEEMRGWLDQSLLQVPPTSATGKALHYLHTSNGRSSFVTSMMADSKSTTMPRRMPSGRSFSAEKTGCSVTRQEA
jgi:hypothetical protein